MKNNYIEKLTEEKFTRIGRNSEMTDWFEFGKNLTMFSKKSGKERRVGEFAILIETPWRIFDSVLNEMVITSEDMAFPSSNHDTTKDFDWMVIGDNLFDEKAENINLKLETEEVRVSSVEINDFFELTVMFSNGWLLQTFTCRTITSGGSRELWRFFMPTTNHPFLIAHTKGTAIIERD